MRLSLRNRLALVFFAITLVAIAALYLYVAPGLQTRLLNEKRSELATSARRNSDRIVRTVGTAVPSAEVRRRVDGAGLASGDRVTLLLVTHLPTGPQLSPVADSSKLAATTPLTFSVATRAATTGKRETGTEMTSDGTVAEAAYPGRVPGTDRGRDRLLRPGLGHRPQRRDRAPRDPRRRRRSRCCSRCSAATSWPGR